MIDNRTKGTIFESKCGFYWKMYGHPDKRGLVATKDEAKEAVRKIMEVNV